MTAALQQQKRPRHVLRLIDGRVTVRVYDPDTPRR